MHFRLHLHILSCKEALKPTLARKYNQTIEDIVPIAISNAFQKKLCIRNEDSNGRTCKIPSFRRINDSNAVYIHYKSCVQVV